MNSRSGFLRRVRWTAQEAGAGQDHHAQEIDVPVGMPVRETVEKAVLTDLEQRRKQKALEWMASQHLPVEDWKMMECQIESRWEECEDE